MSDDVDSIFHPHQDGRRFKYFLVDTTALMTADGVEVLVHCLMNWLDQVDGKLVITDQAYREVEFHVGSANLDKYHAAGSMLQRLLDEGRLSVLKVDEAAVQHGMGSGGQLLDVISQNIYRDAFVLITQDEILAQRAFLLTRSAAIKRTARSFEALFIHGNNLYKWEDSQDDMQSTGAREKRLYGSELEAEIASKQYKVIVDTCSILLHNESTSEDIGPDYFEHSLFPVLKEHGNPLLLLRRVKAELTKMCDDQRKPALATTASRALAVLQKYHDAGLLIEVGEDDEIGDGGGIFADALIMRIVSKYQSSHDLCVISQDRALNNAILRSRDNASPYKLLATRINLKSVLTLATIQNIDDESSKSNNDKTLKKRQSPNVKPSAKKASGVSKKNTAKKSAKSSAPRNNSPANKPFPLCEVPRQWSDTLLPEVEIPRTGARLSRSDGVALELGDFVASGGEGNIFRCSLPGQVCKIYHATCRTKERMDKLNLMLSQDVELKGVAWPTGIVNNNDGEFVGFLMPDAKGKNIKVAVQSKIFLKNNYPSWTRKDLTMLARRIVRIAEQLHAINVFVGDVNALNILVDGEGHICFVDADSFQVGDYPCPVGTETFTPAIRQGMDYKTFLRTADDELFAFATMIFMVLFPGKAPYSLRGGGEISENIKEHRFAYDPANKEKPPEGPWTAIWSHLSLGLKQNFIKSFAKDTRVSLAQWEKNLTHEIKEIEKGKGSDELFPVGRFVKEERQVKVPCSMCSVEHQVDQKFVDRLKSKGHSYRCDSCSAKHSLQFAQDTRKSKCDECGKELDIRKERYDALRSMGKDVWCRSCKSDILNKPRSSSRRGSSSSSSSGQGNSGCFVATAAFRGTEVREVRWLRRYRDRVLEQHSAGRVFSRLYYRVGPWLAFPVDRSILLQRVTRSILRYLVGRLSARHSAITLEEEACSLKVIDSAGFVKGKKNEK